MPDAAPYPISARHFDGVIFDLDGVVTRTAKTHAAAWKRLFDEFLCQRDGAGFEPFSIEIDYVAHVDGRPRYEGVETFLRSRGIALPYGDPSDPPSDKTVCGLGNKKNHYFRDVVASEGVEVYDKAVDLIRRLKDVGIAVAVVTASKNGRLILENAGLDSLFDARVDGIDVEQSGLKGKPEPDTFLEAACRLGSEPRHCVVIEDALVGVEAGRSGGFGLVVGVDRHGNSAKFLDHGADVTVDSLGKLDVEGLASALDHIAEIATRLRDRKCAVCLDYDGTLTPIVPRPEQALLSESMRQVVHRLAQTCPVAVVTGRELATIRELVDLAVILVADHGFELAIPGGPVETYEPAKASLPAIAAVARDVEDRLGAVPGILIERKQFSVAVHYRLVDERDLPLVHRETEGLLGEHAGLRLVEGKKVHEFRPDLDWDKGRAVAYLAQRIGAALDHVVYIGDDVTDEDAFRAIRDAGIGIVVWETPRRTAAAYFLSGPSEVERLLGRLARILGSPADD